MRSDSVHPFGTERFSCNFLYCVQYSCGASAANGAVEGVSTARGPTAFVMILRTVNFILPSALLCVFRRVIGQTSENAKRELCFVAQMLLAPGRIPNHFHLDEAYPFNLADSVLD